MNTKLTYHVLVLGCQMNKSDSERIQSIMNRAGFKLINERNQADILIIVACSVRQAAINRVHSLIHKTKIRNQKALLLGQAGKIIITGCMLPSEKKKFLEKADAVIDIKNIQELPNLIHQQFNNVTIGQSDNQAINSYFHVKPSYSNKFSAYVPIMTGCDNYCSYCAVPYTRGKETSRPVEEILNEVNTLVVQGYKEIILLGQNVNSYKSTIITFPELLKAVNNIPGNFWIRFVTSHPKDLSNELIEVMANSEKVTEYLHLAIQAGDDEILEKMNRKYTAKHYLELIEKIRKKYAKQNMIPAISTDVIVGFPGETKEQFENTKKTMEIVGYDMAYIAQYSPRPGTAAAKFKDDVPKEEKKKRERVLTDVLRRSALENNRKLIGQIVDVLVESCEDGACLGKTRTFKTVKFEGDSNKLGEFVKIKIDEAGAWGLKGKIYES